MDNKLNIEKIIIENKEPFIQYFMEKQSYPKEAQEVFIELYKRIMSNAEYSERIHSLMDIFMNQDAVKAFEDLDVLAEEMEVHTYTMSMLFLLLNTETLLARYNESGISNQIFSDSLKDLSYKLIECYDVYGIWGTFVRGWYPGFYQMELFALGRLQYELTTFALEDYEINGITVRKGDKALNMHIPSCGSFSEEKRLDSYKKAYAFFEKEFKGKSIPMVCSSWLLNPEHKEFLPEYLNIRGFMNDFTYIKGETGDKFEDGWRVFGKYYEKGPKEWPRETTLQMAYAKHLENGGKAGSGYGVFLFDGEKIIR